MLNYCGINNLIDSIYIQWIDFWFVCFQIWICVLRDFSICDIGMKIVF